MKSLSILFRTDSSFQIGTGHVMRCLTLAAALRDAGADCRFVCRELPGNLISTIADRGYKVTKLPSSPQPVVYHASNLRDAMYSDWLGTNWESDAEQTLQAFESDFFDWLIIDHYALDIRWEKIARRICKRVFIIDDLANRTHDCDILIDQNLGRKNLDYDNLIPKNCRTIIGAKFAILRPEFLELRSRSLSSRDFLSPRKILISMGGIDKDNHSGEVLDALLGCNISSDYSIKIMLGSNAPWANHLKEKKSAYPWSIDIIINTPNVAQLMSESDFAIGAAGTSAWERCCLGLPTISIITADNQTAGARALESIGATILLEKSKPISIELPKAIENILAFNTLSKLQYTSSTVTDGSGVAYIVSELMQHDI